MSRTAAILRWLIVFCAIAVGFFFSRDLRLSDDAFDLLPGEAVRGDLRMLQRMGLVDRLYITVSASHADGVPSPVGKKALQESTRKLGELLAASGRFSYVLSRLPEGYEFSLFGSLQPSLPLLFDDGDMAALDAMISPEGIKNGLQKSFALLNSPAGIALKKQVQFDPLGLTSLALTKLNLMRSEFSVQIDEGFFMSKDGLSCLLVAQSAGSLTDSAQAKEIERILAEATSAALTPGIEASVIGSLPHTLANSRSIEADLRVLLPVATVLLVLLFMFAFRDIRALVVVGVPYLAAPMAIGLTTLFHGKLSGLALGFGIVLLGIAVDYSIHLYLALIEGEGEGDRREALKKVARPMLYAFLTTGSVFIVLMFSQVPSHQQMALLAFFGILFAAACACLVIPTIAPARPKQRLKPAKIKWVAFLTPKRPGLVLLGWMVVLVLGAMSWPRLHYNGDLRALDVPDARVKEDERHFTATWGGGDEQAFILAAGDSLDEVLDRNYRVYRYLKEQGAPKFQSFAPLLPGPAAQAKNLEGWQQFWATHRPVFDAQFAEAAAARGFSDKAFSPFFAWLGDEPQPLSPEKFLGGPLQPLFSSMLKIPAEGESTKDSYLAMTTVAIDDRLLAKLLDYDDKETGITVLANKKWRAEVERLLRHDVVTLSLAAGLIIALLVVLEFRNGRAVAAALAPVISALAAMSIFCYLTGRQLNMMHLIMGVMVIGLSVDYGIFIVCAKLSGSESAPVRGVSLCAASTLIGFGVLAFAHHPALHALGMTVLVGIGMSCPTALFVSPALLVFGKKEVGR